MRIRLIWVGRTEAGPVRDLVEHYLQRVKHHATVEVEELAESRLRDVGQRRMEGSQRILKALRPNERMVLLDEVGRTFTSVAWAAELSRRRDQGQRLALVVGGAHGVTDAVRERADLVLSLSAMTFTHQLVRVVLIEQLYRAFSIMQGTGYHH